MLEAGVSAGIALIAGMATLTTRMHRRINELDTRVDKVELHVAQNYVTKTDYQAGILKLEEHMIRIESKLDAFIQGYPAPRR